MENVVKRSAKPVFIIWIISVLCYLPLIARGLTNSVDGLWASSYFQAGNMELSAGRWAWLFFDKARAGYNTEPFNSLLTLLLIAMATYIAINMFIKLQEKPLLSVYVFSMIAMCSITVCCYLSYTFQAPTFGMSVLLSVGAAWAITKETEEKQQKLLLFGISCALLVVSLGLYQANIGIFCVIIILTMMKAVCDDNPNKCLGIFVESVLCGIISCILYKVAWDVCLFARKVSPTSYNGADSLTISHMIVSLPNSVMRTYHYWIEYFKSNDSNYIFSPVRVIVVAFIFACLIVYGVKKLHKSYKNLLLYCLLILLLPIGANFSLILAPDSIGVLTQMTFPMMMIIPLTLSFLSEDSIKMDKLLCFCALLLLYGNIYAVGTDIDAMAQGSTSSYTIMNNIVMSMNEKGLISDNYKYAFYGNISKNVMFKKNELYDMASGYAKFGTLQKKPDMIHKANKGLVDDIGINLEIVDNTLYLDIFNSGILSDMPAYPSEGSIIEKDGIVIVKVSDDYEP